MYAVAVTILFKDGKLGELKDFFENTGFPALEVLKGEMYSIAFFNPKDNVNLGIAFMKDKETADKFAEIRNENLMQIQDILDSFPRVYEGELITGKTLKESLIEDSKETMFLAFAKYGKDILPSWGPAVGNTVGYGIGIVTIVFLAGLFPDAAFIPLNVILGVVLTPAWFFAISKAYAS